MAQVPMTNVFKALLRDEVAPVAPPCDCPSGRAQSSFKAISAAVGVAVKLALTQDAPPAISRKLHGNARSGARWCRCGAEMVGDVRCSRAASDRRFSCALRRRGALLPALRISRFSILPQVSLLGAGQESRRLAFEVGLRFYLRAPAPCACSGPLAVGGRAPSAKRSRHAVRATSTRGCQGARAKDNDNSRGPDERGRRTVLFDFDARCRARARFGTEEHSAAGAGKGAGKGDGDGGGEGENSKFISSELKIFFSTVFVCAMFLKQDKRQEHPDSSV